MTTTKLKQLVSEAVRLDRQQNAIAIRLDEIKTQLLAEADTRSDEYTPTEGGGWSWIAEGSDGCIARITKSGPTLKASISSEKDLKRAKEVTGKFFHYLFEPKMSYKLCQDFRSKAAQLLTTATALRLVKAFTTSGRLSISYETKEVA